MEPDPSRQKKKEREDEEEEDDDDDDLVAHFCIHAFVLNREMTIGLNITQKSRC
jgi:hypothetical protein